MVDHIAIMPQVGGIDASLVVKEAQLKAQSGSQAMAAGFRFSWRRPSRVTRERPLRLDANLF